jgi:hypothetical protein
MEYTPDKIRVLGCCSLELGIQVSDPYKIPTPASPVDRTIQNENSVDSSWL